MCLGKFRVIGWDEDNLIAEMVEIPFNQAWTRRQLQKFKRLYRRQGYRVTVEEVHRPMGGWDYH
jgi:hypothetical protein